VGEVWPIIHITEFSAGLDAEMSTDLEVAKLQEIMLIVGIAYVFVFVYIYSQCYMPIIIVKQTEFLHIFLSAKLVLDILNC